MKHRLQTLLKHKLQWMFLFAALLGVNQGVWSAYSGTTVYLDLSGCTGWRNDNATFALKTYTNAGCTEGGSDETAFSSVSGCTNLYSATITNGGNINGIKVLRKGGGTTWNSASVDVSSGGYNCIRVTGWDSASYDKTISPFSVYFDNTITKWDKVYICLRSSSYWENNGTGGQGNTYFGEMSQVGQSKIYTATNSCGSSVVAFCEDNQYNYQYFHNTKAAYSDGSQFNVTESMSSSTPLFTPSSNSEVKNNTNYYSGAWSAYSSCTAPQASDITISKPSSATTIYTTTNSSGDPETSSQELSASCDKGDTYQWSVSPATITSNHAGGDGKSYERAVFTDGSQKSGSVKFIYEGVYKVKFSAGCSTTSVDKEETINTITVKPGKLYLSGPLINEDGADNFNTSYEMTRNDNTYTYTWTVANASSATKGDKNDFQIKKTTRNAADEATRKQLIPTYSTLTLQDNTVTKATSGNRDLYANISYSAGDQLKCTVTYAGPDNNGVPQYTVKLEKVCSAPTLSNFTITGSLEQTLSGLTAISASSNTQGYNPSIEVQYNGSSNLPVSKGVYPVTLVVGANGDYCASTVAVGTLNVYEVIVKAKKANIDDWGDVVYLHYWGTCNPGSEWETCPKMNYDGSEWYTLGLNCTPDNILFKNATGKNPGKQSVDQSFSPDDCYEVLNEMDGSKHKVKVHENCQLCTAPTVVTNNTPENVTGTTATLKCTVTEAGDCQNPEIGIAYGTSEHPTSGTGGTVFGGVCSVDLTNLVAGKYYYYRAYTTVGGTTTYGEEYGFYTKPADIYIKGLIIHSGNGCPNPWPTDNTAFSKNADGTVFTKTITARKPNCSYDNVNSDAEFVLMSSTAEEDKLNVKGTFNPDGQNSNWIKSKRSGDHDEKYNFKYSAEYNAGDQLTITVTFMSDGTFKMKVSPACDTEVQKKNISIASSAICSGSSVNVTVASSQSGVTYTVYDAANNEVGTGTGTGGDLNISVSPSASTTFTVKGSQGAACESTTMNNTVDVTVWNAPKYSPTSNITAYLPITITGTAGSSWSITSPSPADNAWLSNTSGLTTVFKAPAGTYTVQDSNTSCATNSVTITVAADSETCQ